ncbi:MAG: GNAT family N-acetyltransferase [Halieaceae bacterium]|jgi:RimJ/RimL family protein N-acetyltransferase|nr:GNAT family N-acetyltransferase [Halieaceae bacterium]
MSETLFTTARLAARELLPEDAPFYMELLNDADFKRYIGDRGVRTLELALQHLEARVFSSYDAHGFGMWHISRRSDNRAVGIAGLVKRDFLDEVDLGYALLPAARGLGYATEAGQGVMDYARDHFSLRRLAAIISLDNNASVRVLERLGFQRQGEVSFPDGGDRCDYYLAELTGLS